MVTSKYGLKSSTGRGGPWLLTSSRDVKHLTNKVLNEVTVPNRKWSMVVCKFSHGFMKPAKTILPHTLQPILTSNRYSELANLQIFSSACESLDNPGDMTSTISSSEHLNSHKGLLNMKNSSSNCHQNLPHQQLSTKLQEPRSESMVGDVCEQYQICSNPTILNGHITYDNKGEIIRSV